MTDEATKAEVIAGFYCCLKLANIISSTTGKLAQGKLARRPGSSSNSQSGSDTFAVVPFAELDSFPAPFMFLR